MFRYRIGCVLHAKKAVVSVWRMGYASKRPLLDMSGALERAFLRLDPTQMDASHYMSKALSSTREQIIRHVGKLRAETQLRRETRCIDRTYDTILSKEKSCAQLARENYDPLKMRLCATAGSPPFYSVASP